MNEWKKVKLGDCIKEVNERTTKNNEYEVLTSSKSGIYSQEEYFDKQVASKDNTGYKIIKRGQFTYRSMSDNGTFTINRLENKDIGIVSPAYPVFEATNINAEYLKYFFQSEEFRKAIYNLSQGSTRTALKYKDLSNIEILLPVIEEQEKIVEIFKEIDSIIINYGLLLKEKNKFVKSLFAGIFINNAEFDKNKIMNVCKSIIRVPFGSSLKKEFFVPKGENTYKVYEQKNAINADATLGTYYIDEKKYNELKRFSCVAGDIIMSCSGTIGKIYQLPDDMEKGLINQALLKFTLDNKKILPIYFIEFINFNINNLETKGTGLQNLGSVSYIKEMKIPTPPIELQNQFTEIVKQIDKKRILLEQQKQNYENLKKGLMQKLLTGKVRVKI